MANTPQKPTEKFVIGETHAVMFDDLKVELRPGGMVRVLSYDSDTHLYDFPADKFFAQIDKLKQWYTDAQEQA